MALGSGGVFAANRGHAAPRDPRAASGRPPAPPPAARFGPSRRPARPSRNRARVAPRRAPHGVLPETRPARRRPPRRFRPRRRSRPAGRQSPPCSRACADARSVSSSISRRPASARRGQVRGLRVVMRRPLHPQLGSVRQREQLVFRRGQLRRLLGHRQPLGLDGQLLRGERRRLGLVLRADVFELRGERLLLGQVTEVALRRRPEVEILQLGLVALVALGLLGLQPQRAQAPFDLSDDVRDPQQVLARRIHPPLGRLLLGLVARDPGGLVDESPPVLGAGRDDEADAPLLDDCVGLRPDAGPEEELDDVAQPRRHTVQQVLAVAVAIEPAGDRDVLGRGGAPGHPARRHVGGAAPARRRSATPRRSRPGRGSPSRRRSRPPWRGRAGAWPTARP